MADSISSQFSNDDRSAVDALDRKRDDLAHARTLSPALVASLETEIKTCEAALVKAREAAHEYDRESAELARATAKRQHALTALNTSTEVDPERAMAIVHEASRSQYLEGARRRRAEAARDAASSAYGRVCKDIQARVAAVNLATTIAGAVVDRDESRIPNETRADVIAWLRLVAPIEGRDAYAKSYDYRKNHPSYPVPPSVEIFDAACKRFFGGVERARDAAAKLAKELGAVTVSNAAE
jgi:hypothetical protein